MGVAAPQLPMQLGTGEGRLILGIGGTSGEPRRGHLPSSSSPDGAAQLRIGEVDEEGEGRGLGILLAHEEQRQTRRQEQHPGGEPQRSPVEYAAQPLARHSVARLIVVLGIDDHSKRLEVGRGAGNTTCVFLDYCDRYDRVSLCSVDLHDHWHQHSESLLPRAFAEKARNHQMLRQNFLDFDCRKIAESDWLISPVLDLSSAADANVTFDFSYALGSTSEDILELRVSTDCGETWPFTLFSASGSQLVTGSTEGAWLPTGSGDWKKGYADLAQFAGSENIRIAFITTNLNGNNLFLDNIEMFVTGFTQDLTLKENTVVTHPNPSEGSSFYVTFKTDERQDIVLQIIDMNGKMVYNQDLKNVLNQTFEIDLIQQSGGIYLLKAIGNTYNQTTRFFLNK